MIKGNDDIDGDFDDNIDDFDYIDGDDIDDDDDDNDIDDIIPICHYYFRNMQSGVRARKDLIYAMNTQRSNDEKTILTLEKELNSLLNMMADMQVYLAREEPWESAVRVMLIREREAQCGRGREKYCDYFNSNFFDGQELMDVGYHPKYRNPRKRFKYQHTEEELSYLNRHSGTERVQYSICHIEDLLPDDDTRIFVQLGEYLKFQPTPGGIQAREQLHRLRSETRLIASIFDDGPKGMELGGVVLAEVVGFILSPIIVPLDVLEYLAYSTTAYLWHKTEDCAVMSPSSTLSYLCDLIIQTDREGTVMSEVASFFVLDNYSPIVWSKELFYRLLAGPLWFWEVTRRVPRMLYDYYVNRLYTKLPPRRKCCLLRYGLELANMELRKIEERIHAKKAFLQQTATLRQGSYKIADKMSSVYKDSIPMSSVYKDSLPMPAIKEGMYLPSLYSEPCVITQID